MDAMTESSLLRRLSFDNAWWALKPGAGIKFKQPPKRMFYSGFSVAAERAGAERPLVVAGPCRAGKSVCLRQRVAELLEGGVKPSQVLFVNLATPSYWMWSLRRLMEAFCRHHGHNADTALHVFLDEPQYLPDWQDELDALNRQFPNARIIAAVSSHAPLPAFGARPGSIESRFEVFILPPLTFLEFLRIRGSETALFGNNTDKIAFSERQLPALNAEFNRYINYGGFPEGLMSRTEGTPPPAFVRDGLADRLLHKDMASLGGISDMHELNRLVATLAWNSGREVSIEDLAQSADIAKNTLRKYLDYLESTMLIRRLARVDQSGGRYQRAVAFKAFLTAPCLFAALYGPARDDDPAYPRLVETAIFSQWLAVDGERRLTYAGWRGGEVDFVGFRAGQKAPWLVAEVDWEERLIHSSEGPKALGQFMRMNCPRSPAYVLTRSVARPGVLDGVQVSILPAALFCYLLHKDLLVRPAGDAAQAQRAPAPALAVSA